MRFGMMNEEQLIRDLRAGNREAMRLLYESHKDRLFTLARGLLGDASTAEDVVHEVFLGFVESLHRYHVNGVPLRSEAIASCFWGIARRAGTFPVICRHAIVMNAPTFGGPL